MGCRVEQELGVARAEEGLGSLNDDCLEVAGDRQIVAFGVLVDPGNGAAGEDVMELLEEDKLPKPLELTGRILVGLALADGRGGTPQFRFAQEVLAVPVALLGLGLAGVGSPVHLKVHLAHPHRQLRVLGLGLDEEVLGGAQPDLGRTFQVRSAARRRDHFARGSASAVAVTERH